jgi:hypothetical protein
MQQKVRGSKNELCGILSHVQSVLQAPGWKVMSMELICQSNVLVGGKQSRERSKDGNNKEMVMERRVVNNMEGTIREASMNI